METVHYILHHSPRLTAIFLDETLIFISAVNFHFIIDCAQIFGVEQKWLLTTIHPFLPCQLLANMPPCCLVVPNRLLSFECLDSPVPSQKLW